MLSQLYIKNLAVIREATIELGPGLNVFTGETGAGKTILINAMNAVLGERTSHDLLRTGEDRAEVSALFEDLSRQALDALLEAGYECDDESVLVTRTIGADGKSGGKINGKPATAAILKQIGTYLVNVHGQHDNQQLLSPQKHIGFVDSFGDYGALLEEYQTAYRRYTHTKRELEAIDIDEAQKAHRIDLLTYQIDEIDAANLQPGEEDALKSQREVAKNMLSITGALGAGMQALEGDGELPGLLQLTTQLTDAMHQAAKYLEAARPIAERLDELAYEFEGFSSDIRDQFEQLDVSELDIDAIERRLDVIYGLKRKYGDGVEEILQYRENAAQELLQIETSDERLLKLQSALEEQHKIAAGLAVKLSEMRAQAGDMFVAAVQEELAFLDMPSVRLTISRREKALSQDGIDELELFISTNAGEEAKSLAKIASGGELARIMLSIKNVLAGRDTVQTMVFDEVDTGISGRAAHKIGEKLRQVANDRQVIIVTHLAQVAAFGTTHLLIEKREAEGRTFTSITPLDEQARERELARITAGDNITELSLQHAREMLENAKNRP